MGSVNLLAARSQVGWAVFLSHQGRRHWLQAALNLFWVGTGTREGMAARKGFFPRGCRAGGGLFREARAVGSGRLASGSMVPTSQRRQRDEVAPFRWLSGARMGAVLVQRPMGAVAVEIVKIIPQDPAQVLSVE